MRGGFVLRRLGVSFLAVVVGVLGAFVYFAPTAGAQLPSNATPLTGVMAAMVVDAATSHVFVSLHDVGRIAVLDFDGNVVGSVPNEPGASGMVVVGSHLYVVAQGAASIDDIDTGTLTRTRTLAGGLTGIQDIVAAAGSLWVVTATGIGTELVRVSTADGTTTAFPNPLNPFATGMASDPADPGTIVLYDVGAEPVTLSRVDVSGAAPTPVVSATVGVDNVHNIAVSPDGSFVVPAGGAPYEFDAFGMSDLQPTGVVYGANPYPTSVAMTAAAGGLFAGGMNGISDTDVVVYHLGDSSSTIATHDFGAASQVVEPGGLAFSPDGNRMFVVTGDHGFQAPTDTFHVLAIAGPPPPTTTTTSMPPTTVTTVPLSTTTTMPVRRVSLTPPVIAFANQRVGTYGVPKIVTITNTGNTPITLFDLAFGGTDLNDFFGGTDCFRTGRPALLSVGAACRVAVFFAPLRTNGRIARLFVLDTAAGSPQSVALSGKGTEGYFLAGAYGEVGNFGDAVFHGDATRIPLNAPMISMATTPNGAGYWLLGRDGGIFTFGNAKFYGSTGNRRLNRPIVTMSASGDGRGYWLVGSDGGIFTFGDAHYYGSTGGIRLNRPIDGMAATPDGRGYWLVASDGGIFTFGDARFYGSASSVHLSAPVVQMSVSPSGRGYWLLTADGHLYGFGDARNLGSAVGHPTVGIAPTPDGRGYWETDRYGNVFAYGDATLYGSLPGEDIHVSDVIAIAGTAPPLAPSLLGAAALGVNFGSRGHAFVTLNRVRGRAANVALANERRTEP
jgi:sugar lactone lactonase YvrE